MKPSRMAIALLLAGCGTLSVPQGRVAAGESLRAAPAVSELSAAPRKARPYLRVAPQPPAWTYPRPGYYSYPGPNAVRQCVDWYVTEYRPSGAVVTPQMRCRWVPG